MQKDTAGGKDLTQGSIVRTLAAFALPFLIANLIQALYGAVDMAVVGFFTDSAGISAVSTGSQVMQIVTSIISGLTMGGTILIAQYFGAGREEDTRRTVSTMFTLFLIAAGVFTLVMLLVTVPFLRLLNTPAEAFSAACRYVWICSCGILFIFGYNAVSAILRALGDSRSPLLFITVACVSNIVLDILLVGPLGLGAHGAAAATVIAQAVSLGLAILHLRRTGFAYFDFKPASFRLDRDKAKLLFRLGLPVSFQETMVSISFLFIAAITNSLGVVASAAVGICNRFESFAMLPATAASGSISSIAAQNIGAGKPDRALRSLQAACAMAFCCSLLFFGWAQLAPRSIMMLFRADPALQAAGAEYLRSFSIDFMLVAFGFTTNGFLNGCGCTTFAMVNGVAASLFIRVPLAYWLTFHLQSSLFGIGLAAPAATLVSVTAALLYLRCGRWKTGAL